MPRFVKLAEPSILYRGPVGDVKLSDFDSTQTEIVPLAVSVMCDHRDWRRVFLLDMQDRAEVVALPFTPPGYRLPVAPGFLNPNQPRVFIHEGQIKIRVLHWRGSGGEVDRITYWTGYFYQP